MTLKIGPKFEEKLIRSLQNYENLVRFHSSTRKSQKIAL